MYRTYYGSGIRVHMVLTDTRSVYLEYVVTWIFMFMIWYDMDIMADYGQHKYA